MAVNKQVLTDYILEGTTPSISATITNKAGNAIPLSSLTTLTLTLYNIDDSACPIINGRNAQDVKNVVENRVTVDANGNLKWTLAPEDSVIVSPSVLTDQKPYNTHRAVFKWTYIEDNLSQIGSHIIEFQVRNLEKV